MERYKSRIIDEAGRIIIPSELRKLLCFNTGDKVSLTAVSTIIILQKVESGSEPDCTLCTVDELGRIELPAELRQQMGWQEKSVLALYHTDDLMILKASENK